MFRTAAPLATVVLLATFALIACSGWNPVRSLVVGEGMQRSAPAALDFESGLGLPERREPPLFEPLGVPVVRPLDAAWQPIALATPARRCFAVQVRLGDGAVSDQGPLVPALRNVQAALVLRDPGGAIVARMQGRTLWRCNWEAHAQHTLDLVTSRPLDPATPLGVGALTVQLFTRELTPDERWELDARTTPWLIGGGVRLWDPEKIRVAKGPPLRQRIEDFEAVSLGELAPGHCDSVSLKLGPDAVIEPEATMFDAPFRFVIVDNAEVLDEVLYAHRLEAGALVSDEICNPTADPIATTLVLAPRPNAEASSADVPNATAPAAGTLIVQAFTRPLQPSATTTAFLARGLAPPDEATLSPVGPPQTRRLEAFLPLELAVPEGACWAVRMRLAPGAKVTPKATLYTHYFIYRELGRAGGSHLAQMEVNGAIVSRAFCNSARTGPWRLSFELASRTGRAPGRGDVSIEILAGRDPGTTSR